MTFGHSGHLQTRTTANTQTEPPTSVKMIELMQHIMKRNTLKKFHRQWNIEKVTLQSDVVAWGNLVEGGTKQYQTLLTVY